MTLHFLNKTKKKLKLHLHQLAAYYNVPPWRREIPWVRRCVSDNPDVAPRASSSSPTLPAVLGLVAVPLSGARPAAKRFVVQARISPWAPSVLAMTTTTTTDDVTTMATSDSGIKTVCRLFTMSEYDDDDNLI